MESDFDRWRVRAAGPGDVADISHLSLRTFGENDGASPHVVAHQVATWRDTRSPAIVVRERDGTFVGYAIAHPNRAGEVWRFGGQVAVLTQVAVVPERRKSGAGSALLQRSVDTLRRLGWDRVFAQVPEELVPWYRRRGWTLLERGETVAWVEPWIPSDVYGAPELAAGEFSPLLSMISRDDYPYLAMLQLGPGRPLMEVVVPPGTRRGDLEHRLGLAAALEINRRPELARALPHALVEDIAATATIPVPIRRALRGHLHAESADGPGSG